MQLKDNTKKTEERKNRFNGESVMLTAEEATKHDAIFYSHSGLGCFALFLSILF